MSNNYTGNGHQGIVYVETDHDELVVRVDRVDVPLQFRLSGTIPEKRDLHIPLKTFIDTLVESLPVGAIIPTFKKTNVTPEIKFAGSGEHGYVLRVRKNYMETLNDVIERFTSVRP